MMANLEMTMGETLEDYIYDTVLDGDRHVDSVDWDGAKLVIVYEDEVSDPHEPGQWIEVQWLVHIYLRGHDSIQSTDRGCRQVYKSLHLDPLTCTPAELRRAIKRVSRCVPAHSPNQPDTPCLQDRYPNHPSFTEVTSCAREPYK